ncbi:MAG: molybdenum cofactor biosynthesis protein MoaE [Gammaproteobacteria bacterium]
MSVKISPQPFDPWFEIQAYQTQLPEIAGVFGATSIFIGTLRDFNEGDAVKSMTLEYYPGMTEKQLSQIVAAAKKNWQVLEALVVHRVGTLLPSQPIVAVAVWSKHRGDAFDACRYIMEALKSHAPFWKKELLSSGQNRWVEKNTDGYGEGV